MGTRIFKVKDIVKTLDGEKAQVVEVLPNGQRVFYRVQFANGDESLLIDSRVRGVYDAAA